MNTQVAVADEAQKWSGFIETLYQANKELKPFKPVKTLVQNYLPKGSVGSVLDIGCEIGKNAVTLVEAGHRVTLLDIAPNAIRYTHENLQKRGLEQGVVEDITSKIEDLDPKYGPFKAVIGTYAFSFIPPDLFENVMKNNVLGRVSSEGYFAGGFFGEKHSWASDPKMSFLTSERLEKLFSTMGFSICEKKEEIEEKETVLEGKQIFHTIEIIAKRNLFDFFKEKCQD